MLDEQGRLVRKLYQDKVTENKKRFMGADGTNIYLLKEYVALMGDPHGVEITIRPLGEGE